MTRKNGTASSLRAVTDNTTMSGITPEYQTETLWMKQVTILACLHLLIAAGIVINNLTHPAIIDGGQNAEAFFAYEAVSGMRLYGPINPHVLELWYTPLAFQIVGLVSSWFEYNIRIMHLVVAIVSFSSFFLLGMTIYRMTRNRYFALIGSALSTVPNCGLWYYNIGQDAFHVFFAVLAIYLLIRDLSLRWSTIFTVTLALFASFWSKQTGLAYLAAGLLFFWIKDWRKGIAASIFAFLLVAVFAGYYIIQPESSFFSMIFIHNNHPIIWKSIVNPVLFPEILGRYGIMSAVVIAGIIGLGGKWKNWIKPEYVFLGASAVVALSCSVKYGSGINQAIFFYAMLIVCGMHFLNKFYQEKKINLPLMLGLLIVQSVVLFFNEYSSMIITSEDDKRYRQILEIMATPGKNVHYINQPFYNVLAGTKPYPSVGRDCWRNGVYDRSRYPESLRKFYEKDPFDIIIIDLPLEDNSWMLYERINANYVPTMEIPPADPRRPSGNTLRNKKIVFYRKNLVGQRPQ